MLSKAGIATLDALQSGREATVQELAAETGYSRKQVYRVIDDLLDAGVLTESRGRRNQRFVRVTDAAVVESYRQLTSKLGHVPWPDLLSPATLRVAWYIEEPRRVTAIADRLGITRQSVHKALAPLKNRAMLAPSGPEYALAEDVQPLVEFARAVVTSEHRTRVRRLAPGATVAWCDPNRALVRVYDADGTDALRAEPDWELSGLAGFQAFGLQFYLAGEPAFWYAPEEVLGPAEVVCHTLVLDADVRRVSYVLLLIEAESIAEETLSETAQWYGLEPVIPELYRFLDGDADGTADRRIQLPSAPEYEALKDQYGVT